MNIIDIFLTIASIILVFSLIVKVFRDSAKEKKEKEEKERQLKEESNSILNELNNKCVIGNKFYQHTKINDNPFIIDDNNDYIKILNIKTNTKNEIWIEWSHANGDEIHHNKKNDFIKYLITWGYTKGIIDIHKNYKIVIDGKILYINNGERICAPIIENEYNITDDDWESSIGCLAFVIFFIFLLGILFVVISA
jgi:hypothetical protein